jgi:hypothetical protein
MFSLSLSLSLSCVTLSDGAADSSFLYSVRIRCACLDSGLDLQSLILKNGVFWDIKPQFVPHRRHITSPLQSPAS